VTVLKGGLIGCGFFSQHHQEAWRRMPNVQIVAACDRQIERAQAAAVRAYCSAEEMLDAEDLDFVDIVTRSSAHLELISMAAERGLAIICQKPLAARLGGRLPHRRDFRESSHPAHDSRKIGGGSHGTGKPAR